MKTFFESRENLPAECLQCPPSPQVKYNDTEYDDMIKKAIGIEPKPKVPKPVVEEEEEEEESEEESEEDEEKDSPGKPKSGQVGVILFTAPIATITTIILTITTKHTIPHIII